MQIFFLVSRFFSFSFFPKWTFFCLKFWNKLLFVTINYGLEACPCPGWCRARREVSPPQPGGCCGGRLSPPESGSGGQSPATGGSGWERSDQLGWQSPGRGPWSGWCRPPYCCRAGAGGRGSGWPLCAGSAPGCRKCPTPAGHRIGPFKGGGVNFIKAILKFTEDSNRNEEMWWLIDNAACAYYSETREPVVLWVRIRHLSQRKNSEDRQSHCVYCTII